MVAALRERGVPVGYLLFEGEQHGFRKAENIRRALDAELYFYAMLILRSGAPVLTIAFGGFVTDPGQLRVWHAFDAPYQGVAAS